MSQISFSYVPAYLMTLNVIQTMSINIEEIFGEKSPTLSSFKSLNRFQRDTTSYVTEKARESGKRGRRKFSFSDVMQTRVPGHVRNQVLQILEEKHKENEFISESDYLRDLIIKDLKSKGRL